MGKMHFGACGLLCACAVSWVNSPELRAEDIIFELLSPIGEISPGDQLSIIARLENNVFPNGLTGYSLNVDIIPDGGASGSILGDASLSNFYDLENLITQGGGDLHLLSTIDLDPGDGGLLVTALTADFLPVDLAGAGHDVFAELIFDVSMDAMGFFTVDLGIASVLSDANFESIEFGVTPLTFEVVPEPATGAVLALLALLAVGRKRSLGICRG